MRGIIRSWYGGQLLVGVARSAGEDKQVAYDIACRLAEVASLELGEWIIKRPDRPSRYYEPKAEFVAGVPSEPVLNETGTAIFNKPVADHPLARRELVDRLESIVAEELERVDAIRVLPWILYEAYSDIHPNLSLALGDASERAILAELDDQYRSLKMAVIEPYLAGKAPVRHTELFEEFHSLPAEQRRVLTALSKDTSATSQIISYSFGLWHSSRPAEKAERVPEFWERVCGQLIETGWAVNALGGSTSGSGSTLLRLGGKGRLLSREQRFF